jgi:hypothetical protein
MQHHACLQRCLSTPRLNIRFDSKKT